MSEPFPTPIVLIIFNRPEPTKQVFEAISRLRPARLLVVADGPREGRPGEADLCRQVLDIVGRADWPCELSTNFSDRNLGCRERVISGLNWVFSLVDEAIILEDDCLPDPSFFPFCQELLARYRGDARVSLIAGTNFVERASAGLEHSYFFSRMTHIWGWATWRHAWARYDPKMRDWPEMKRAGSLRDILQHPRAIQYFTDIFDKMHAGVGPNTWDYQWTYTNFLHGALSIVPKVNLVTNIGFGPDATHTLDASSDQALPSRAISFPLRHPAGIVASRELDSLDEHVAFVPTIEQRIRRKSRRILARLRS